MTDPLLHSYCTHQRGPLPTASRRSSLATRLVALAAWTCACVLASGLDAAAASSQIGRPARRTIQADHNRRPPDSPRYGLRDDVQAYIRELVEVDPTLDPVWLQRTLGQARFVPQVTRLIMPAPVGVSKNWQAYRDRFIEASRIEAGLSFWAAHEAALKAAEQRWGVPAELIVGIIGVETFYGRITGNFTTLDALATLAFDFPTGRSDRSGFFRDELTSLLQLARREGLDLRELRGSYAGAIGWGQFMPSSWTRFGVDFDGDGHADLYRNPVDTIGSVAHFLAAHGWQSGLPTHLPVEIPHDPAALARLLEPDIVPTFTAAQLTAQGARLIAAAPGPFERLALIELHNGGAPPSYVAGTRNFWVVTRYNWSAYYAMAVIELGQAVARRRSTADSLPILLPLASPGAAASSTPTNPARRID